MIEVPKYLNFTSARRLIKAIAEKLSMIDSIIGTEAVNVVYTPSQDFELTVGEFQPCYPHSTPIVLNNPDTLPAGFIEAVAFSPCGEFLAVGHNTTPFISIYQRNGTEFTKLANPATLPGGMVTGLTWSPSGEYLMCANEIATYICVYQRVGKTFTKLANPATLPTGAPNACAISPNGEFYAIAHDVSPYITIYQRTSATVLTKIANPDVLPTGLAVGCSFSRCGRFLSVAHAIAPYLTIYERVGSTFVKLANVSPPLTGQPAAPTWSIDSKYLIIGKSGEPVIVYKRNGNRFTKMTLTSPPVFAPNVLSIMMSHDGTHIIFGTNLNCYGYRFSEGNFTPADSLDITTFSSKPNPMAWSRDMQFIAYRRGSGSPYIKIIQTSGTIPEGATVNIKGAGSRKAEKP